MSKTPKLYDATAHLELLFQDAGVPFPPGLTFIVPVAKWRRWVKQLHLKERAEVIKDADRPDNPQD